MNGALFCAFASWFGLMFMPLRLLVVLGLWIAVLQNSEFVNSLGQILLKKVTDLDKDLVIKQANTIFISVKSRVSRILHKVVDFLTGIYEIL